MSEKTIDDIYSLIRSNNQALEYVRETVSEIRQEIFRTNGLKETVNQHGFKLEVLAEKIKNLDPVIDRLEKSEILAAQNQLNQERTRTTMRGIIASLIVLLIGSGINMGLGIFSQYHNASRSSQVRGAER